MVPYLDFLDPWGNRLEIIEYANIQFTKAANVMRGMGLALTKNDKAKQELADKGMAEPAKSHVTQGIVVPADGGTHFNSPTPGRCFTMKLVGRETNESIMMFEESLPAGTTSLFHLHHDSDEVIWVLAGEFSFMIGDTVTVGGPGTCAFMPRDIPHAWKNTGSDTGRSPGSLYSGCGRRPHRRARREPTDRQGGKAQVLRAPSLGSARSKSALKNVERRGKQNISGRKGRTYEVAVIVVGG